MPTYYSRSIVALILSIISLSAHGESYNCVGLNYPPLIQAEVGGRPPTGLAVDIVASVFKQIGHSVNVEIYPWARSQALVKSGDKDCIFTIIRTAEREQFLDFSAIPMIPQFVYFFARKGDAISFNGELDSIKERRVGTVLKVNYGPKFEEARTRLTIDSNATTLKQLLMKLVVGRVDLVPSTLYAVSYTLAEPDFKEFADKIVRLKMPIDNVPMTIAFPKSKNLNALRDSFDLELQKFLASDAYKRLLEKYNIEITPELVKYIHSR